MQSDQLFFMDVVVVRKQSSDLRLLPNLVNFHEIMQQSTASVLKSVGGAYPQGGGPPTSRHGTHTYMYMRAGAWVMQGR